MEIQQDIEQRINKITNLYHREVFNSKFIKLNEMTKKFTDVLEISPEGKKKDFIIKKLCGYYEFLITMLEEYERLTPLN